MSLLGGEELLVEVPRRSRGGHLVLPCNWIVDHGAHVAHGSPSRALVGALAEPRHPNGALPPEGGVRVHEERGLGGVGGRESEPKRGEVR